MNEELTEGCTFGKQGRKPTCVPIILADIGTPWRIDTGHALNTKGGKKTIAGTGYGGGIEKTGIRITVAI